MSAPVPQTADLSNWRESPYNQWSFHNIDKVLNTQTIPKSSIVSQPLEQNLQDFTDFKLDLGEKGSFDLAAFLAASEADALLVLKNGQIVYEEYLRGNAADQPHIMMSMTKSITGLVVGILQEQGKLDVDAPVVHYLPEVRGTPYEHVTVRQCLDMRAGIRHDDANADYRGAGGWRPALPGQKFDTLRDYISNLRLGDDGKQDDRFEYVSLNTDTIGWVVERAAGGARTFAQIVSDLLWQHVGAEHDALVAGDPVGTARAAGGMAATARDLARVGQLIVDGGRGIVPRAWLDDIVGHGDCDAFARGAWARGFQADLSQLAYRSYFLANRQSEVVMMLGIHGQQCFADRKNNLVMVKFASQAEGLSRVGTQLSLLAFQEFQRLLA